MLFCLAELCFAPIRAVGPRAALVGRSVRATLARSAGAWAEIGSPFAWATVRPEVGAVFTPGAWAKIRAAFTPGAAELRAQFLAA